MRFTKALGFAGALIVAALVGGTLINTAFGTDVTDTTDPTDTAYCDVFRDAFASELGVTDDQLTTAGKAAVNAAIDAAVAAGDLDEDRAATFRERIEGYDGDGCDLVGRPGAFGRGFDLGMERGVARGFLGGDVFEAAADALGLSSDELMAELRDAGSVEALAGSEGVAYDEVKAAVLAAIQADLDAAVAEGMPQERADAVIERLSTWLDDGGELGAFRPGRVHHGPMHGGGFGPWHDTDDAEDAEESGT